MDKIIKQKKITIPKGWEIDKIEGNIITFKESKKELPNTWKKCFMLTKRKEYIGNYSSIIETILEGNENAIPANYNILPVGLGKPMLAFTQLLLCREIYRNGWKPELEEITTPKYYIKVSYKGDIICDENMYNNRVLSFQSLEVRDKFLENFHDLIKEAKMLI